MRLTISRHGDKGSFLSDERRPRGGVVSNASNLIMMTDTWRLFYLVSFYGAYHMGDGGPPPRSVWCLLDCKRTRRVL